MEGAATTTAMEAIMTGFDSCLSLFTKMLDVVTTHPILALIFAGGTLVPIGFGIFHNFKRV